MVRVLPLLLLVAVFAGCRSYTASTPSQVHEGDHPTNYTRVFRELVPTNVTVVNSEVITYSFRLGVVTTDDFEFELLVPPQWIQQKAKRFYLMQSDDDYIQRKLALRRERACPWYAPKQLDQYDLYRDAATSVGYIHMLVQKEAEPDSRQRVFISKH